MKRDLPTLALYAQVKDHISRKIQDGTWPPGHRLPSEHELVAQFGMARMTVNRALRELVEQGRIVRVAGVGSFVAENKPQSTLLQIANIASEIRQRGRGRGRRARRRGALGVGGFAEAGGGHAVFLGAGDQCSAAAIDSARISSVRRALMSMNSGEVLMV